MGRINMGRVIVGGLLAGLIINISEFVLNGVVFAEDMNAAMAAINKPPIANSMIVWFVILGFGIGSWWSGCMPRSGRASGPARRRRFARRWSSGVLPTSIRISSSSS